MKTIILASMIFVLAACGKEGDGVPTTTPGATIPTSRVKDYVCGSIRKFPKEIWPKECL